MSGNAFDRTVINPRERPLSTDVNSLQSTLDRSLRDFLMRLFLARASSASDAGAQPITGFIGEALKARPTNPVAMALRMPAGMGFFYNPAGVGPAVGGISGVDDLSVWAPLLLNSDYTFSIPNGPSSPNSRIDIIEVNVNRHLADSQSRDVLDVSSGVFVPTVVQKTLAWDLDSSIGSVDAPANSTAALSYKRGVPGNPGTEPSTTPGYTKIARINVGSGATTLDADSIVDARKMLFPFGVCDVSFKVSMPSAASTVPTLSSVIAPPGVTVVAVGQSTTNSNVFVYIFGGDLNSAVIPVAQATAEELSDAGTADTVRATTSFVTVDSALQTALSGVNASPATKVAIGQTGVRVALKASSPSNPQTYNCTVHVRGGF